MANRILQVAKAILAAIVAFIGAMASPVSNGNPTMVEWITAVVVAIAAFSGVYSVPNAKPTQAVAGKIDDTTLASIAAANTPKE